jgi:ligand-binding sensor domain-containing protein
MEPSDYADFQASVVRGQFNNETRAVENNGLSREKRLWANTKRGCWRNTEEGNKKALLTLLSEGFVVRLRGEEVRPNLSDEEKERLLELLSD